MDKPKKILVVDDDRVILTFAGKLLTREGHDVVTASDGFEALNILSTFTPDIIFFDLIMPKIDGDKLIRIGPQHAPAEGLLSGDRFRRRGRDRFQFPGDWRRLLRGQGPLQRHGGKLPRGPPGSGGPAPAGGPETPGDQAEEKQRRRRKPARRAKPGEHHAHGRSTG